MRISTALFVFHDYSRHDFQDRSSPQNFLCYVLLYLLCHRTKYFWALGKDMYDRRLVLESDSYHHNYKEITMWLHFRKFCNLKSQRSCISSHYRSWGCQTGTRIERKGNAYFLNRMCVCVCAEVYNAYVMVFVCLQLLSPINGSRDSSPLYSL